VLDTKAKESLTTRVGYQDYRSLESVLSYLLKLTISDSKIPGTPKKYRFLVEPKSKGTKSYASMLKMISLKDAIEAEFKQAIKVNEVSHEAAKMDRLAGANGWAKSLSDKDIDLIDNEETKLWAQTMKQPRDEVAREFIKNVHALPTTSYGLVLPEDTSSRIADPRPVSPGDRYPLLKHVGNISANTKAAIQYINLIDSHLSKQTS
jgi:hypothetical protein